MFWFLKGEVSEISSDRLALDVGGVGYELYASGRTLDALKAGQNVRLEVHTHITQDSFALYGFSSSHDKAMFKRLISVSRVGPKVALSALSIYESSQIAAAIVTGDEMLLARVPGLGKKTAQRIILELKEKIAAEEAVSSDIVRLLPADGNVVHEAVTALIALGYDNATASRAVKAQESSSSIEQLITNALKSLARM